MKKAKQIMTDQSKPPDEVWIGCDDGCLWHTSPDQRTGSIRYVPAAKADAKLEKASEFAIRIREKLAVSEARLATVMTEGPNALLEIAADNERQLRQRAEAAEAKRDQYRRWWEAVECDSKENRDHMKGVFDGVLYDRNKAYDRIQQLEAALRECEEHIVYILSPPAPEGHWVEGLQNVLSVARDALQDSTTDSEGKP